MADKFYSSFAEYFHDTNTKKEFKGGLGKRPGQWKRIAQAASNYEYKQRETRETAKYNMHMGAQETELETLRSGQPKTVSYSTAVSVDDVTKAGIEADDERARAAALEQLEKERLGAQIRTMGSTSLLRGLK
jgi:hypothetical protein